MEKTHPPFPPSANLLSGPSSRLLAELLSNLAAPASYPGARPSFELVAAVKVDCRAWRRLHRSRASAAAAAEIEKDAVPVEEDAAASSTSTESETVAAASLATTVVPIWLALAEEEAEGLRLLELLHSSLEETGNDDDDGDGGGEGGEEQLMTKKRRRRRPRSELATARRRAARSLVRASLLRFARLRGAHVVATAETATRCAASAVAAAAAGAGAALPLEVAGCDRRFCCLAEGEDKGRGRGPGSGSVSFVRPFVSVPASDVEAAARLLGLEARGEGEGGDEEEEEKETDGVLAAAVEFLGAAQLRVPSTATSVVAALGKLAPCGWAGRRSEDASRREPPRELCDLCAAGPWTRGDGAEVEVEGEGGEKEKGKKKVLLRLCYPCSTVALGAPPAPAGASPVVPRAAARKMAQALFGAGGGGDGGLWGKR